MGSATPNNIAIIRRTRTRAALFCGSSSCPLRSVPFLFFALSQCVSYQVLSGRRPFMSTIITLLCCRRRRLRRQCCYWHYFWLSWMCLSVTVCLCLIVRQRSDYQSVGVRLYHMRPLPIAHCPLPVPRWFADSCFIFAGPNWFDSRRS